MDDKFLEMGLPLSPRILIFARITPEGKSSIIAGYRQQIREKYLEENKGCFRRLLKGDRDMVGMCGDGANDLLALREADLSVGLKQTDASYGSSFTAANLTDVPAIIREGETVSYNIVHIVQYYITTYFIIYSGFLWLNADATYLSSS